MDLRASILRPSFFFLLFFQFIILYPTLNRSWQGGRPFFTSNQASFEDRAGEPENSPQALHQRFKHWGTLV